MGETGRTWPLRRRLHLRDVDRPGRGCRQRVVHELARHLSPTCGHAPGASCSEIHLVGADGEAADREQGSAGGVERRRAQPGAEADAEQVDALAQRAGERVRVHRAGHATDGDARAFQQGCGAVVHALQQEGSEGRFRVGHGSSVE